MMFKKEELVQELVDLRQLIMQDNQEGISIPVLDEIIRTTASAETPDLNLTGVIESILKAQMRALKGTR